MLDSRPCVMLTGTDDTVTLVTANLVSGHYCGPAAKFGSERGSYKSLADTLLLTLKHTLSVKTNEGWHLPSLSFSRHRCPVSAHAQAAYMQTKKAAVFNLQKFSVSNFFFYHEIADSVLVSAPPTLCQVAAPKKKKVFPQTLGFYQKQPSLNLQGNITFVSWCSSWPEETLREFFLTVWFGWTRATALRNVFKDSGFIPLTAWQQMKIQTNRISSPVEFSTRCVTMLVNPDSGALETTQTIWKS